MCDCKEDIFGTYDDALNLIYMLAKLEIWKCRFYNRKFSLVNFSAKINNYVHADTNAMSIAKFEKKWFE